MSVTEDDFLGGRIKLCQPATGYRAGVDPVLLAAAVPARAGQNVLDLGCGVGAASFCLAARVSDLQLTGIELQATYADLARQNAALNQVEMDVVEADVAALPAELRTQQFDHVITNPPYYDRGKSTASDDAGRDIALGGETPLSVWIEAAAKRLKPKGYFTLIQRADRLMDVLCALEGRLGSVRVKPLAPREGREAALILVQARKNGRADFVLDAPLILHEGAAHTRDGESYRAEVLTILREAGPLSWAS